MSLRNTAAGIGLSLLPGCADACGTKTNEPEIETVSETISAKDPGSEDGRNKIVVSKMEDQVGGQVEGRIDEILERLRVEILTGQTDPTVREFFGSSCAASFHNVDGTAYEEPIPNKADGYSIQELTVVKVASELPRVITIWGEYQNEQWAGGFNVVSICIPSGAEKVAGKSSTVEMEETLLKQDFKRNLDLSSVLNDDLILQNTTVTEKLDLANRSTAAYGMNSTVTVFMKDDR